MSSLSVTPTSERRAHLARLRGRVEIHLALLVATLSLLLAWGGLVVMHKSPRPAIPKATALRATLGNAATAAMLRGLHWDRAEVTPQDSRYELLGFYRGPRMLVNVTVIRARHGLVLDVTNLTREKAAYGSNLANNGLLLGGLSLLFMLMTGVWPLRRLRNLDAIVATGTVLSVVLINHWMLTRMVLVSYSALSYLALRAAWWGLTGRSEGEDTVPLFDFLTRRWEAQKQRRVLGLVLVALALTTAMVGFTSPAVLDVGYAVMEGATNILHGLLPYGHIPDVLHGDTYPIVSYLLYVPLARLWPVTSTWDNADATLVVAIGAAVLSSLAVWRLVRGSVRSARGKSASGAGTAGPRAAIAVLAFPPALVTVSTGTTDVALAAMLAVALLLWHRPGWLGAALSAATWFKLSPLAIVPIMLARLRGAALGRAIAGLVATSLLFTGVLIAIGGTSGLSSMLHAMSFQFTRSSPHTLWTVVGSVPLQQLCQAAVVALIAGAVVHIRRDAALSRDPCRLAAISVAVLIGVQISANYWNYMYLVWVLPFLVIWLLATESKRSAETLTA